MSQLLEWAGASSGPLGVMLGVGGKWIFDRRSSASQTNKVDADAAKVFTEIAVALVGPLETRISKLERENVAAFQYIRTLLAWINVEVPHKAPPSPPFHIDL